MAKSSTKWFWERLIYTIICTEGMLDNKNNKIEDENNKRDLSNMQLYKKLPTQLDIIFLNRLTHSPMPQ